MKNIELGENSYGRKAVLESNQHEAHQCQLGSPGPGGIPGRNTFVISPCLMMKPYDLSKFLV